MTIIYTGERKGKPFVRTIREPDPKVGELLKATLEKLGFKCSVIR